MAFVNYTEQESYYHHLDKKSISDILADMNNEDKTVPLAVEKVLPEIEKLVAKIVERMKIGGRIFYVGAGTSGRLAVLDAAEIPPTFGLSANLVIGIIAGGDEALKQAVEFAEDDDTAAWEKLLEYRVNTNDTVIGVAASGNTPFVVGALKQARANGIATAAISCNTGSPVAPFADNCIEVLVGPEYITGSTRLKSGTAQKLVLNMISTSVMIQLGRVKDNKMVHMLLTNEKLIDRGARILMAELQLDYEQARNVLQINGSVKKALSNFKK